MTKYAIVIVPLDDEDGGGYLGFAPDLPGCMSDGETQSEALQNTQDAIGEWLDLQRSRNVEIPDPGSASALAQQREEQLLDAIRSLADYRKQVDADYREQVDEENKRLKRKLAELIAVLKDTPPRRLPNIDVEKSMSNLKPTRPH
ncbi:MAG: type II toxin-antitoxin system HicB family antitoxin [Roseovarius sp.]|nr:type II toxin-antitoxin system HicB family antitoxin [Roseovarius sp.]